mgnify:CR=1 FL=1
MKFTALRLTKGMWNFNPRKLANETRDAYSANRFTSWERCAMELAKRGFNVFEAEAILRSKHTRWCRDEYHEGNGPATSGCLSKYLDAHQIGPRCKEVNDLVMGTFGVKYKLELNEKGIPCHRGTMPGNYDPKKTILVPLGTPACCDPTTETYWCM